MTQEESGLDELLALSRKFTKQKEDNEKKERQRIEQGKKVKGVLDGLKDLNLQMALTQLKAVAEPEIIQKVSALKSKAGTDELRKMITVMADNIEKQMGKLDAPKEEITPVINSVRTLSILLDLYFSLS